MDFEVIKQETRFKTSRSGGAGGQHVNKVSTKVELLFDVNASLAITASQRERILHKLANKIDSEGILHVVCSETRSQLKNKEIALKRLLLLLKGAIKVEKVRRKTKPSKAAMKKRLDNKKKLSQKKESRRFKPNKN